MAEPLVVLIGGLVAAAAVFFSQFEQQRVECKLDEANEQITRLSKNLVEFTIGGEGYCYASIAKLGVLVFVNDTNAPLYDVSVRIVDVNAMHAQIAESRRRFGESDLDWGLLQQAERHHFLGNIGPNSANISSVQIPLNDPSLRWNLFYSARNGFWTQQIMAAQADQQVEFALRVARDDSTLFQKVPDAFPRTGDGSVNW